MVLLGILIGAVITAFILYPQIQNRYKIGFNTGYIQGGNIVIEFLSENIHNNIQDKTVKKLEGNLHHKAVYFISSRN